MGRLGRLLKRGKSKRAAAAAAGAEDLASPKGSNRTAAAEAEDERVASGQPFSMAVMRDLDLVRDEVVKILADKKLAVPEDQKSFLANHYDVHRYLVARKGDIRKAGNMLAESLIFRHEKGLAGAASTTKPDHANNCFFPCGIDNQRRLVIYSSHVRSASMNMVDPFETDVAYLHAFSILENSFNDPEEINRIVWVVDFRGFGYRHCSVAHAVLACNWFGNHLPERLGQIVLLDPPTVFRIVRKVLSVAMDPDSLAKIQVLSSDAEKQNYFRQNFKPEIRQYITELSNTEPVQGGAFPPDTDLSLVEKTKWWGPPTTYTAALVDEQGDETGLPPEVKRPSTGAAAADVPANPAQATDMPLPGLPPPPPPPGSGSVSPGSDLYDEAVMQDTDHLDIGRTWSCSDVMGSYSSYRLSSA